MNRSSLLKVRNEFPRNLFNVPARPHHAVEHRQLSRFMHDDRRQRVALEESALRIAKLTRTEFRAPYAVFRAGLARVSDRTQRQAGCDVFRLLGLRSLVRGSWER